MNCLLEPPIEVMLFTDQWHSISLLKELGCKGWSYSYSTKNTEAVEGYNL